MVSFSVIANASDQLAVQTIKKMYETGKSLEKGNEIIYLYADKILTRAINVANEAENCISYDVMWQSNDPPYDRNVSYNLLDNNKVEVHLAEVAPYYEAETLIYDLNCSIGTCKITDVEDDLGSSVHNIYQECQ